MARFLVYHAGSEQMSQEEVVRGARQIQQSLPQNMKWLNSWFVPSEYRLICEWEAPDQRSVRSVLGGMMRLLPVEAILEVEPIRPEWYTKA